jgi:hypothetical protein
MGASGQVPYHAEHRNLLIDAFLGGFWVAAMQFNPLPSATTISMMAMNNVAIGGLRFLLAGWRRSPWDRRRPGGFRPGVHPETSPYSSTPAAVADAVPAGAGLDLLSPGLHPRPAQT